MKATFQQLLNAIMPPGNSPLTRFNALPVKISAAIRLKLVFRSVDMNLGVFYEHRNALIEKYGEKQEDGTFKLDNAETNEPFQAEHRELMACEVDVLGERFTLLDLFTAAAIANDQIMISRADLDNLSWLIDEGTDEESVAEVEQPLSDVGEDDILELEESKAASA